MTEPQLDPNQQAASAVPYQAPETSNGAAGATAPQGAAQNPCNPYQAPSQQAYQQPGYQAYQQAYQQPYQATYEQPHVAYQQVYAQPVVAVPEQRYPMTDTDRNLRLVAFIFCILSLVGSCWLIIPLAWMIPISVISWGIYKGTKANTVAFGVCTLIFCSLVAGILLLCSNKDR